MVNLLPSSERHQRRVDLLNYYTLVGGLIVTAGAIALAGALLLFDQVYRYNLQGLQAQKQQTEAQSVLLLDTEKKAKDLEKQLALAVKAQGETTHWATLVKELQTVTPANVSIDSINFKQGTSATKTEISGKADSRRSVAELQVALTKSKLFKGAELESTALNGNVITYKISVDVNYDQLKGPA